MKKYIFSIALTFNLFNLSYAMENNIAYPVKRVGEHQQLDTTWEQLLLNLFEKDNNLVSLFNKLTDFLDTSEFSNMSQKKRSAFIELLKKFITDKYTDQNNNQAELTEELQQLINDLTTFAPYLNNIDSDELADKILKLIISGANPNVICTIIGHILEDYSPTSASAPILNHLLYFSDLKIFNINFIPIITCLILYGADVNFKDYSNNTPIIVACFYLKNLQIIRILLNFGAKVDKQLVDTLLKYHLLSLDEETIGKFKACFYS